MTWPYPRVIAHRGGGVFAPENTLAALRRGKAMGFAGVEFDVMLSGDGVAVVIHDETLERTTTGSGRVADTPCAALAALDAGRWFSAAFEGERVPSYVEAVELCVELGLWANVEIKPSSGCEADTGRIVAASSAQLWRSSALAPLLSSFSVEALAAARDWAPDLPRGLLTESIAPDWQRTLERYGCVSLHCDRRRLTEAQAGAVRDAGYALVCYTVNVPDVARRLFDWGVNAVFTDRLDLISPGFS